MWEQRGSEGPPRCDIICPEYQNNDKLLRETYFSPEYNHSPIFFEIPLHWLAKLCNILPPMPARRVWPSWGKHHANSLGHSYLAYLGIAALAVLCSIPTRSGEVVKRKTSHLTPSWMDRKSLEAMVEASKERLEGSEGRHITP